jgi:RNA polymerase sigma factor for flagellar operon FliA
MTRLIPARDRPTSDITRTLGRTGAPRSGAPSKEGARSRQGATQQGTAREDPLREDPTRPPDDPAAALWAAYRSSPGRLARDRLVLHYRPLVGAVVRRTARRLPAHVEPADLVQSGILGLLDAIERYDPCRCPRFEGYAVARIRGAVLDELRAQDWVPRTVRLRAREAARVRENLTVGLRRTTTEREVADVLRIGPRELRAATPPRLLSIELLREGADGATVDAVVGAVADDPDPAVGAVERETHRQLWCAVAQLGERDRLVVRLYYLERRTLAEVGRMLGVTESRICQLHSRLVGRLRGALEQLAAG